MNPSVVGKILRELRGNKTLEEVANDLGISVSALTMYELGNRVPRDEIKIKLASYYNKTVGFIFFSENVTYSDKMNEGA